MKKLSRSDLWSLEQYAERRPAFRAKVMAHKRHRRLSLGEHATLYFEDELTIRYQIQEMLRVEKVFEAAGIEEELEAYNPLIPDGSNWKATFMLEYDDAAERERKVVELRGIERRVWVQIEGFDKVCAIADEDLEREDATRTSTVHFLRFELNADMVQAAHRGVSIGAGIDHAGMNVAVTLEDEAVRNSLLGDLDPLATH